MNSEEMNHLLDKIADLAGEHCIAFSFCALVDKDDENAPVTISSFDGGTAQALGCATVAKIRLENRIHGESSALERDEAAEDEDDDE